MYVKQALGIESDELGKPPASSTTVLKYSGTGTGSESSDGWKKPLTEITTGVLDVFKSREQAKGAAEAYKSGLLVQPTAGGMPGWLLPAAIGGGVLLLVLMMRR